MTHFLRFTDESAFHTACESAGLWINDSNPRPLLLSHTHILDVLGPLAQVTSSDATLAVGLTADHTSWEYSFTPPELEPGETFTATVNVNFSNQNTGDFDSAVLEVTTDGETTTIERLIFDPEDPSVIIGREPVTNTTDNPGSSFDAWHVNAKLQELPAGWDTYVVTPGSPVRVFAGDS